MRKIIMLNRLSVDGFFAGPHGEIDWFVPDPEVDRAAHEMMHPDTLLLGRVTYQMFEQFWPQVSQDPNAPRELRATANELDQMNKVVFSNTLPDVTWMNTQLVKGDLAQSVRALKEGSGPDITLFGSGSIAQQLIREGLMDEYLVVLTPVVLGSGKALFKDTGKVNLKLAEARNFKSGNVLMHYTM